MSIINVSLFIGYFWVGVDHTCRSHPLHHLLIPLYPDILVLSHHPGNSHNNTPPPVCVPLHCQYHLSLLHIQHSEQGLWMYLCIITVSWSIQEVFSDCFCFSREGWLCFGGSAPALLLPRCVLLYAAGGSAALPHGSSGFPHHAPPTLPVHCRIWSSSRHCHHLCHRLPLWIRHQAPVSVFVCVCVKGHRQMDINVKITKWVGKKASIFCFI